jgi:hypothetical protein
LFFFLEKILVWDNSIWVFTSLVWTTYH